MVAVIFLGFEKIVQFVVYMSVRINTNLSMVNNFTLVLRIYSLVLLIGFVVLLLLSKEDSCYENYG